ETEHEHWRRRAHLINPAAQFFVAAAYHRQLPGVGLQGESSDLGGKVSDTGRTANHEHGEPVLVEAEPATQRLLLARRRGAEAEIHRQASSFTRSPGTRRRRATLRASSVGATTRSAWLKVHPRWKSTRSVMTVISARGRPLLRIAWWAT